MYHFLSRLGLFSDKLITESSSIWCDKTGLPTIELCKQNYANVSLITFCCWLFYIQNSRMQYALSRQTEIIFQIIIPAHDGVQVSLQFQNTCSIELWVVAHNHHLHLTLIILTCTVNIL